MTALRGSCLCGGVRFEIDGPLMRSSHCHCRQCQKAHGAPFRTRARVAAADFRFLAGEELFSFYELTPGTHRGFCKVCGAPVLVKFDEHSRSAQTDPAPWRSMASRWRRLTTIPASAPTRARLSSTRRRGSRSPTICPTTRRVSPARTLHTSPDRSLARDCGSRRHADVCWSFGEGTFAGKHRNGRDAPKAAVPPDRDPTAGSTRSGHLLDSRTSATGDPKRPFGEQTARVFYPLARARAKGAKKA